MSNLTIVRRAKPKTRRKKVIRRQRVKRSPFTSARSRLSGKSKMPYFRYARCYDHTPISLSVSSQTSAGFWLQQNYITLNSVPNITSLTAIYRFFRIRRVIIQYTPAVRSDEYIKMFPYPVGQTGGQPMYTSNGGSLEIKQLAYSGFMTAPTSWADALNRSGKLRKCATTKAFRRTIRPKIDQLIEDYASGQDPKRSIASPWLSTDIPNNLSLSHYLGYDCFHTLNNISYDSSQPLVINMRVVAEIEFKGLKI